MRQSLTVLSRGTDMHRSSHTPSQNMGEPVSGSDRAATLRAALVTISHLGTDTIDRLNTLAGLLGYLKPEGQKQAIDQMIQALKEALK